MSDVTVFPGEWGSAAVKRSPLSPSSSCSEHEQIFGDVQCRLQRKGDPVGNVIVRAAESLPSLQPGYLILMYSSSGNGERFSHPPSWR